MNQIRELTYRVLIVVFCIYCRRRLKLSKCSNCIR
nr:MAG TPA: hypothetical protein [Caudoviricetes sp.]